MHHPLSSTPSTITGHQYRYFDITSIDTRSSAACHFIASGYKHVNNSNVFLFLYKHNEWQTCSEKIIVDSTRNPPRHLDPFPVYELYFDNPITMIDSFFVGIKYQCGRYVSAHRLRNAPIDYFMISNRDTHAEEVKHCHYRSYTLPGTDSIVAEWTNINQSASAGGVSFYFPNTGATRRYHQQPNGGHRKYDTTIDNH